jgi:hypothetical protein
VKTAKHRESWERFVSELENDITRPEPQTYKIIKNIRSEMKDNVIPHETWLSMYKVFGPKLPLSKHRSVVSVLGLRVNADECMNRQTLFCMCWKVTQDAVCCNKLPRITLKKIEGSMLTRGRK